MRIQPTLASIGATALLLAATTMAPELHGSSAFEPPRDLADRIDTEAIAAIFEDWNRSDRPGCVCAISDRQGVIFEDGYGMANLEYGEPLRPDSVFYVASVAKQFTAASAALLVERGLLSWDDDARRHLPQLGRVDQAITVRQLAQHTSGVRDYFGLLRLAGSHELDYLDNAQVLRMLARQHSLQFAPGTLHDYSNSNYVLLVELVERLSGKSFLDFTQEEIFTPLGMASSRFENDHRRVAEGRVASYEVAETELRRYVKEFDVVGDGGLLSTAADLTAWGRNLMASAVLRPETLAELVRRGRLADGTELDYGMGHRVGAFRGTRVVGHTGSFKGFRTRLVAAPEHGIAVAVLCNADNANATALSNAVLDTLLPEVPTEPLAETARTSPDTVPGPIALEASQLDAWAGDYWAETEGHTRRIYVEDGVLYYGRDRTDSALEPVSPDSFLMPGFGIRITLDFERDAAGDRALTLRVGNFQTIRYQEYQRVDPEEFDPAGYVGVFVSDELDARYRIDSSREELHLELANGERAALQPVTQDLAVATFDNRPHALRFRRGTDGKVSGFAITSGWIRGLWFDRAPAR